MTKFYSDAKHNKNYPLRVILMPERVVQRRYIALNSGYVTRFMYRRTLRNLGKIVRVYNGIMVVPIARAKQDAQI